MATFTMRMDTHDWDSIKIERDILGEVDCEVLPLEFSNDQELIDAVRHADAVLPRYVNLRRHHIEAMERCQVIARSGIGWDIVDVDAATERGIWVTNAPDYCVEEVADHAAALILASVRKLLPYQTDVRRGIWSWQAGKPVVRMSEAVFGLIGYGKIGREIWQRIKGFGSKGLIFDPFVSAEVIAHVGARAVGLEELLRESDIVHVQCPLTKDTHHLIAEPQLRLMKPSAVLTNAARGPIVDEAALYQALKEGRIAGAGLDDLEEEPAKVRGWRPTNPILQLSNVIVTPHTAWYSESAVEEVKRISASEIARVLSGREPLHPVNRPDRESP